LKILKNSDTKDVAAQEEAEMRIKEVISKLRHVSIEDYMGKNGFLQAYHPCYYFYLLLKCVSMCIILLL